MSDAENKQEKGSETAPASDPPPPADAPAEPRTDGPTLEEFVLAGYAPEMYPPEGYAARKSGALECFQRTGALPKKLTKELERRAAASSDPPPPADAPKATKPHHTICKVVGTAVTVAHETGNGSKTYYPGDVAEFADTDVASLPEYLKPLEG